MLKYYRPVLFLLTLITILGACGTTQATLTSSPADLQSAGEALFTANGCVACHALEPGPDAPEIGPVLHDLATRSLDRINDSNYTGQAETAEAYIRESILKPEIYLVEEYPLIMPKTYETTLTEADLATLVNFLTSLK